MAELIIEERVTDEVVVLDLTGDIVFGQGTIKLRNEIRRLLAEGRSKIWLNLEKVGYLDSSGIGELISGLTAVSRIENGQLKLLNLSKRVSKLLEICKLINIFDTHDESKASGK